MSFQSLEKSGILPEELVEFFTNIKELSNLNVLGLMTIGSYEASTSGEINKDFQVELLFYDKRKNAPFNYSIYSTVSIRMQE